MAEGIDWDSVTPEELERLSKAFSFDHDAYIRRINNSPNWTKVIVAHIYMDHILSQMIRENFFKPEALINDKRRKYLLDKMEICEASGYLKKDLKSPILKINKLRNNLAHNLSFKISSKEINDLRNSLSAEYLSIINDTLTKKRGQNAKIVLSEILILIVTDLEIMRQKNLLNTYLLRHGQIRLRKALDASRPTLERIKASRP